MATVSWSTDARKAFALYFKLNSLLGLWPLLRVDLYLKIRIAIGITQVITMMGSTLYEMIQNCGDAEDFLDNLLVLSSSGISLSKLIMYHVHRDELSINIASAIRDWSSIETTDYRSVMIYYKRIYKNITFVLITAVSWCGILYSLKVFVIDPDIMVEVKNNYETKTNVTEYVLKKRYLFPSTCTLNDVSRALYSILILNQCVQMVACCIVAVGSDAFFLAVTTHLCGQFEILKMKFASVDSHVNLSTMTTSRQKMGTLILRHQHLLRLTKHLESAYNKIVLTQILTSITLISVAGFGFLIALQTSDFFGSVKSLVVMLYMLLQSFMYTCIGEALQNQGDDLTQSVYDASWYDLPRYLSRDLIFVMMRSNKSPCLTAGKFFYMTRATFMDVVKTSSSYLSILRIMLNE